MLFAFTRSSPFSVVMSRDEDWKVLGEEDWKAFEDEDWEAMLQGLPVSTDRDTANESDASMNKHVHTLKSSEGDDA
ncbi:hypothetical protein KIN20_002729 [Parelaphostrongylus tenuis]|uniref:Uncharacterized protein n=1 Tax=Parelaphostrongylus tenuis TaxID=148309 RepID=A0AAD5QD64_PARTN|nr:hypothetical protein KIN20_002729 [Parelaphostrongylus tenuis]